jgi:hypothetical protein
MKHLSHRSFVVQGRHAAAAVALAAVVGCGSSETNTQAQTAANRANYIENTRCAGVNEAQPTAAILGGQTVLGVRPLYSGKDPSKGDANEELHGAIVTVAAEPGVTPEWLNRMLECHSAAATLGQLTDETDPFFLPGAVVDITVQPAKDGFAINVSTNSPQDGQRILDRAKAWASANRPAVSSR